MKKSKLTRKIKPKVPPKKSREILVTQVMLEETEQVLKHEINSSRLETRAFEKKVDARFNQVDARFNQVDARFKEIEAKLEKVLAAIHKTNLLVEEQNARNRYVLDGYTSLHDSQELLKARVDALEK